MSVCFKPWKSVTPLFVHQKLIGVCQVINCQHGVFSSSDQQLLEAMVPMMAIAIDNAHTHQQLLDAEIFQHDMMLRQMLVPVWHISNIRSITLLPMQNKAMI